mgnify:CR=1 FL=1
MKFSRATVLALCLMLLVAVGFGCTATKTATKEEPAKAAADWKFHSIVDVKFVQQYANIPRPEKSLIIDSRPKRPKFDKGYIPSAISLPDSKFDELKGNLPENKEALLIFYCQGPT